MAGGSGFPIYRKTTDDRHFYRIEDVDRFTEVQVMGSRRFLYHVKAEKYPERLLVQEMIEGGNGRYLPVDKGEWMSQFASCVE